MQSLGYVKQFIHDYFTLNSQRRTNSNKLQHTLFVVQKFGIIKRVDKG